MSNCLAADHIKASIDRIRNARVEAQPSVGIEEARANALLELGCLLREEREALDARPYGFGHGWNVWALTVEIEGIRRSKGSRRSADMPDR